MITQRRPANPREEYGLTTKLTGSVNGQAIELVGSGSVRPGDGLTRAEYVMQSVPSGFDPHLFSVFLITGFPGVSKTLPGAHNIFYGRNQWYTRRVVFSNGEILDYEARIAWLSDRTESRFVLNGSVVVPPLDAIEPIVETWIPNGPGRVIGHFAAAWKATDGRWIAADISSDYTIDTNDELPGVEHRFITIQTVINGTRLAKNQQVTLFRDFPAHPRGELPTIS